jgi:hypothetical protein
VREPLLTLDIIATELSVSVYTVRRWIRAGKLYAEVTPAGAGANRLGYRVSREELDRFKQTLSSATPPASPPASGPVRNPHHTKQ